MLVFENGLTFNKVHQFQNVKKWNITYTFSYQVNTCKIKYQNIKIGYLRMTESWQIFKV